MNKTLRYMLLLMLAALLLGGLLFLVYKTQAIESTVAQEVNGKLHGFEEIDTRLNLNALRSYMGMQQNYDQLTAAVPAFAETKKAFNTLAQPLALPGWDANTQALYDLLDGKSKQVESFKTHHAVLRNALYAVPTLLQDLHAQLDQVSAQLPAGVNTTTMINNLVTLDKLRSDSSRLVSDLLGLVALGRADNKVSAERLLADLQKTATTYPPEIHAALLPLLSNAKAILDKFGLVDGLLHQMENTSSSINQQLHVLEGRVEQAFNQQVAGQNQWRQVLAIYSAGLLLLLGGMGWRLWGSYRSLDQANALLEQRVEARTRDLSGALANLRESQLQLIQSEKMASLGQMVAGIAHEINTPLAYVKSGLEILDSRMDDVDALVGETSGLMTLMTQEEVADDSSHEQALAERFASVQEISSAFVETEAVSEIKGLLGDGLHGIAQISEIVSNLKDFSRLDRARLDEFNVNDGVISTLKIARNIVKHRQIEQHLGDVPLIMCSPSQINQVLLNLINNACQATDEDGGVVTIVTRAAASGVAIEVIDNGKGILPEHLSKIFDPFFTTKKVGEGTGLGLSIVQRIVKEHGGEIKVASTVGVGTCFTVLLPCHYQPNEPAADDQGGLS